MTKLGFLLSGYIFLSLLGIWVVATAVVPAGHRPGCPAKCGDVDIPFPFGIREQCALHNGFKLNCTTVEGVKKPLWWDVEVAKISLANGTATMNTKAISRQCYFPANRTMRYRNAWLNLTETPFWISEVDNTVVVIGCNTLAYMMSSSYVIGCVSTCEGAPLEDGTCSGAGCCQADVPKGIQYYNGYFNENYNTTKTSQGITCSYITVMEKAAFRFKTSYVKSTMFYDTHKGKVPIVLNWQIAELACEDAKKNTSSYACVSSHSVCVDSTTHKPGYRCNCSEGYEGNPYIADGCRDIDECRRLVNPCGDGICENTPGNYSCSCYLGNYMTNGVCVPIQKKPSRFQAMPVVGASVGLVVLVIVVACACLIQERRKLRNMKLAYFRQHGGTILFEEMKSQQCNAFKIFSEEELQQATNRFSEKQVIGRGGHGTVYKGLLKSNVEVAVKRCMTIDEQHKKEFGKEMLILAQINHRNVVKLLGCCLEVEVPMLVYEFVPNGTLFDLIHGNHGWRISLATRLGIAHDSAEALSYLHSGASTPILHGDVKSSNILLDDNHKAKVSDFGASILAPTDESQFVTLVQGTCGYLDPEYMQTCQLTDKSDVYSFGVVLLELLTCKKPFNLDALGQEKSLSIMFMSAMKENRLEVILDDGIKGEDSMEILEEIVELAKHCLEMSGENRPSMKEVAEKLDRLRKVMHHPWVQQNPEEMESLLGEPSAMAHSTIVSDQYFSIEKKAVTNLQSGR
ncbi:putative wall-associated receptor kinase-like 16 [Triticum dicoccoides]|uniref:putative wall-associated receptor kinase-like 16 n=1 Tax=Triticum dicoccoides TaxID=85692 RepID=UPI0018911E6F|nr:putative wall-associated receptor kinase-like 16 [Triticum dicoccoides]